MQIKNIISKNFRNYENLEMNFDFTKPINLILAQNGMGKSNFLEIIYYLSYLRPFRPAIDNDLIYKGKDFFFIDGKFTDKLTTNSIQIKYCKKKEIILNENKIRKHSEIIGLILSVLFSTDDIFIIVGNPLIRRRFFDMFFSILDRYYLEQLQKYQHFIKQKNLLLKNNQNDVLIDVFDWQISECIEYIQKKRTILIEKIDNLFQEQFQKLGLFKDKTKILFLPSIKNKEFSDNKKIYEILIGNRKKDIINGYCMLGPHRDNYLFLLNGIPFMKYASFGQIRLAALVLKLIQKDLFYEINKENSILLIDDVILELDSIRQKNFISELLGKNQVFITLTDKKNLNILLDNELINEIRINNGKKE